MDTKGETPDFTELGLRLKAERERMPPVVRDKRWTEQEKMSLATAVKKQFQQAMIAQVLAQGDAGVNRVSAELERVKVMSERQILEENTLRAIDWVSISRMLKDRAPEDCRRQWLRKNDMATTLSPWTPQEDEALRIAVNEPGSSWASVTDAVNRAWRSRRALAKEARRALRRRRAVEEGLDPEEGSEEDNSGRDTPDPELATRVKRTQFQCLARFQRKLNSEFVHQQWTPEADEALYNCVMRLGDRNWRRVAMECEGKTPGQCMHR